MIKHVLRIILGLVLTGILMTAYLYSGLPLWEDQSPDGADMIGMKTGIITAIVFAFVQVVLYLCFRRRKSVPND